MKLLITILITFLFTSCVTFHASNISKEDRLIPKEFGVTDNTLLIMNMRDKRDNKYFQYFLKRKYLGKKKFIQYQDINDLEDSVYVDFNFIGESYQVNEYRFVFSNL
ncbi:MAG: hypothetical protein P8Q14_07615, partial [Vicingaceae bacterium]|nr:hypothetical protein [Vicingaceae bacterium]